MRKVSLWLVLVLVAGMIQPFVGEQNAFAAGGENISPITAEADTNIDSTGIYGKDPELYVGRIVMGGSNEIQHSAIKFNLSSISGNLKKASLKLYMNYGSANVEQAINVWGSSVDEWNEEPTSVFPSHDASNLSPNNFKNTSIPKSSASQYITIDVTDIVKNYVNLADHKDDYITLVLTGEEASGKDTRISLSSIEGGNKPQLEITSVPNQKPSGSLSINSGSDYTSSANVTLNLTGTDPDNDPLEMQFSNDNTTWSNWEPFNATKSWTLTAGDGPKTVYMQLRDGTDTVGYSDSITLDTIAPVVTGVTNGAVYNSGQRAEFTEGTATLNGSPYTSATLISTEGLNTLIVTDRAGNITSVTFRIDQTKPSGMVTINSGAVATNSNKVTLNLSGSDPGGSGVTQMEFSLDGSSWSGFETYTSSKNYEFSTADGVKKVFVHFKDAAGNVSEAISATIMLDTVVPAVTGVTPGGLYASPPTITFNEGTANLDGMNFISGAKANGEGPHQLVVTDTATNAVTVNFFVDTVKPAGNLQINNGTTHTNKSDVTLTLSASDPGGVNASGLDKMQFSQDGTTWSSPESYSTSATYTLTAGEGIKTVHARFIDKAGNISDEAQATITLDTQSPKVEGVTEGTLYKTNPKVTFDEGNGKLDNQNFTSGSSVNTEGAHKLVVTDEAGNTTTINFFVDTVKPTPGTLTINSGKSYTNKVDVTLTLAAVDPGNTNASGLNTMQFSQDEITWSSALDYSTTASYSLTAGDGMKTVYARFIDTAGNVSDVISSTITLDTVQPVISGATNGEIYNKAPEVSFNEGTGELDGQNFISGSKVSTEGQHRLIVTDEAGNAAEITFFVDTVKPTGSIVINNDDALTRTPEVTLTLTASDPGGPNASGLGQMQFSQDGTTWGDLEAITVVRKLTLTEGDALKTVYARFTDQAGNVSDAVSSTIILDSTPPEVSGVTDQAFYSTYPTVTFTEGTGTLDNNPFTSGTKVTTEGEHILKVTDLAGNSTIITFTVDTEAPVITGVVDNEFYHSDPTIEFDEGTASLNGEPFVTNTKVDKEGKYTLIVTDKAKNITTVHFTLDKTAPTGTISINEDAAYTGSEEVTLTLSSQDNNATVHMQLSHDGLTWGSDESYTTTKAWTFADPAYGLKKVYVRYKDQAGNVSETYQDSIELTQTIKTNEDTDLQLKATDFHANSLQKVKVISLPEHGALKLKDSLVKLNEEIAAGDLGNLRFIPEPNWHGSTVFNWNAGVGTSYDDTQLTIVIEVVPVEDIPVAKDISFAVTDSTEFTGVLLGSDGDGDGLTYEIVKQSTKGKVTVTNVSKGEFKYKYTQGDYGTHTFTYRVTDGKAYSNEASVTINISAAPQPGGGSGGGSSGNSGNSGSGNSSGVNSGGGTSSVSSTDILLNGVVLENIASSEVNTANGNKATLVTLNESKLNDLLNKDTGGAQITIPVMNGSNSVTLQLNGRMIKTLEAKHARLIIQTETSSYTLPTERIQMENLAAKFGSNVPLQDIQIRIEVTQVPQDKVKIINLGIGQIVLITPGVDFTVKAVYKGKELVVDKFNGYVERMIGIPEGVDPSRMTTGVVISPEGRLSHVPTKFIKKNGKYYAVINSMSNSLYSVIYNKATFADSVNHWAHSSIENMASRLVIQGVNSQQFRPDSSITRAEFTAIVVRALGLKLADKPVSFDDVRPADWFHETLTIAVNADLKQGYENHTFQPNSNITREEAMVVLAKAMKSIAMNISITDSQVNEQLQSLADNGTFHDWSRTAAALNIQYGIMKGDQGKARPESNITRAEATVMIERLLLAAGLINDTSK